MNTHARKLKTLLGFEDKEGTKLKSWPDSIYANDDDIIWFKTDRIISTPVRFILYSLMYRGSNITDHNGYIPDTNRCYFKSKNELITYLREQELNKLI